MNVSKKRSKKSKAYYIQASKKKKFNFTLAPGMKGFIVTCNNNEKQCIREAYNILNEYADKLYGTDKLGTEVKEENEDLPSEDSDDDIEKAIKKEVEALKSSKTTNYRFQVVESKAKNCLFIKTQIDDPCKLVHAILQDIAQTQQQKSRYLLRMIPVSATCKAYVEDIKKTAETLFDTYFKDDIGHTYAVMFKVRNNNTLNRDTVISGLAEIIKRKHPKNKADLKNPEFSIIVDVICTVCCLSVLSDYFKYKKYNLIEIVSKSKTVKSVKSEKEDSKVDLDRDENISRGKDQIATDNTDQCTNQDKCQTVTDNTDQYTNQDKDQTVTESTDQINNQNNVKDEVST